MVVAETPPVGVLEVQHNFTELPRIRSERTAFELHYPRMVDRMRAEAHVGKAHGPDDGGATRIDGERVRT